jgi:L-aminopeptidase/D-esterase-like protein
VLTDISGVAVGHWTNNEARTGCTVVVFPKRTTASGEVRGGAPATREFALLEPLRTVSNVDAVVLSGGSAFGLAAADGVMEWMESQDRGFETAHGRVPIVVGMSLFDLGVGDGSVRPTAANGRDAARSASADCYEVGQVGAGTGATMGKWHGGEKAQPGGLVTSTIRHGDLVVSALIAVNAVGAVDDGWSTSDLGAPASAASPTSSAGLGSEGDRTNTTIGVVVTNAEADKVLCHLLAQSAHDGLARSLLPAHTSGDGDAIVAAATGEVKADAAHLRLLAQQVVVRAIRSLIV